MKVKPFSEILKEAREKCGMSQKELAIKAGVSIRTVSRLEGTVSRSKGEEGNIPHNSVTIRLALATDSTPEKWLALFGRGVNREAVECAKRQMGEPSKVTRKILGEFDVLPILKTIMADGGIKTLTFSQLEEMIEIQVKIRELQVRLDFVVRKEQ